MGVRCLPLSAVLITGPGRVIEDSMTVTGAGRVAGNAFSLFTFHFSLIIIQVPVLTD